MKRLLILLILCLFALCSCELLDFSSFGKTALSDSSSDSLSESSSDSSSSDSSSSEADKITLTYLAEAGGGISGEAIQKVEAGTEAHTFQPVTAVAEAGYNFLCWSDGSTEPTRTDTLSESATFTALFAREGYARVEYRADVGGSIKGTAIQYIPLGGLGEQIEAVADEGYVFTGWSDADVRQKRTDTGARHIIVTAKFKAGYRVSFNTNDKMGKIYGLNPQIIEKGKKSSSVSAVAQPGYRFVKWSNGSTNPSLQLTIDGTTEITAIFERYDLELPALIINTATGDNVVDHSYIDCAISVANASTEYCFTDSAGEIRGRGNTSGEIDKRSYKIKLDRAVSLFGNGEAREWTLISNHFDLSLIRNYLSYSLALNFDALRDSATTVQFVDLYMNNEYRGVYLVCEQVEVGKNRVDIDMSWDNIDTGYLIELDDRLDGQGFYINGQFYGVKDPDTDYYGFTSEHMEFIRSYTESCLNAIYGTDYELIESLIDTKTFAQAYIVFEMFNCVDVGFSSFFMYKDAGGKLCCGPIWDFDRSVGNVSNNYASRSPESLYAKSQNAWFNALLRHDEFKALVAKELHDNEAMIRETLANCYASVEACKGAFDRNFKKWDLLGGYVYPNPSEINRLQSWQEQVDYNKSWLERSLTYMLSQYPTE